MHRRLRGRAMARLQRSRSNVESTEQQDGYILTNLQGHMEQEFRNALKLENEGKSEAAHALDLACAYEREAQEYEHLMSL